jgi:TonB family protein
MKWLAATILLLSTAAPSVAAPPPALLAPSGPWHVEYAGTMCLLSRPYGPKSEIRLILKPSMIGDKLELIVTTAKTLIVERRSGKVAMLIAGNPVGEAMSFSAYSTAKARLVRIWNADEKLTLSSLRDTLAIDAQGEGRYQFVLTGIERARPAVNACLDQLRTMYNVTKNDLAPIVTEPDGIVRKWFRANDYPAAALAKNQSGTVGALLWVEATGLVSKCEIIEPTAAKILEEQSCAILQRRGRFVPAKDAAGRAIRAPVTTRINWQLAD